MPKPQICKRPTLDGGGAPVPGPGQWWLRLPDGPISGHWLPVNSWASAMAHVRAFYVGQAAERAALRWLDGAS